MIAPGINYIASRSIIEFVGRFGMSLYPQLAADLLTEEAKELVEALGIYKAEPNDANRAAFLKELCDVQYCTTICDLVGWVHDDPMAAFELVEDIEGAEEAILEGLTLFDAQTFRKAFNLVHQSNMSKLGDDGQPVRRHDGKIMKGPNYKPPNLLPLV